MNKVQGHSATAVAWDHSGSGRSGARGHLPALDGLRALAVAAVVLFHSEIEIFRGGWLGVNLFVVLSGWLITGILIDELAIRRKVSYVKFMGRRVRRLVPAVMVLLAGVGVLALAGQLLLRPGPLFAAITWSSNWYQLASSGGYWEQADGRDPLEHLWSLAVEEQFYLVWPLFLLLVGATLRTAGHRRRARAVRLIAGCGALVSAAVSLWGTRNGWSLDRMYLGTDTRSFGFLIGAACAGMVPKAGTAASSLLRYLGPLCAAALLVATSGFAANAAMFGGAIQLADLACLVVVVWTAGFRRGPLASRPLVALGRWSYGIYLWHWPVLLILTKGVMNEWWRAGLASAISIAVAAMSFRWIEQPLRQRPWLTPTSSWPRLPRVALIAPLLLVALSPGVLAVSANGTSDATSFTDADIEALADAGGSLAAPVPSLAPMPNNAPNTSHPTSLGSHPSQPVGETTSAHDSSSSGEVNNQSPSCRTIVHLGDSNLGIPKPLFEAAYRAAEIEAFVDHANGRGAFRSFDAETGGAIDAIATFSRLGHAPRCWVLQIGAQDAADAFERGIDPGLSIAAIVDALQGDPTIWLIPALHGEPPFTEEAANAYATRLVEVAAETATIHLVDWKSIADRRVAEFQPDGIHYQAELYMTLAKTVLDAIRDEWSLDISGG